MRASIASTLRNARSYPYSKTLLSCAIALSMTGGNTYAVDGESEQFSLEEIVVTARKRSENTQDIPIAITALSKEIVNDGNFDELNEYMELVPNATFSTDTETSSEISIRGSARNQVDEDPSVGVYRDGVYIGGLLFSSANFYDVEQVEVLRGPQAGLYGRNAVGGALNVTSEKPDFNSEGYVDVQLGSKDRQEYRFATNLEVIEDVWALRLAGLYIDQDRGFNYDEKNDQYLDAHKNKSIRLRSLYTPDDSLEFLTTLDHFSTDGSVPSVVLGPNVAMTAVDSNGFFPVPGTSPDDTDSLKRSFKQKRNLEQFQAIQEINYDLDQGTLTALGSYRTTNFGSLTDRDYDELDLRKTKYDASQDSTFLEIRFASNDNDGFRYTVGATFMDEETVLNYENVIGGLFGLDFEELYATGVVTPQIASVFGLPAGIPIDAIGLTPFATGWGGELGDSFPTNMINEQTLESFSTFVETNYTISDTLEVWGNLRYTQDEKTIEFGQYFGGDRECPIACAEIFDVVLGVNPEAGAKSSATFENFSPGIGINYQINNDILTYAKLVTGFKAGGFNSISGSVDNLPFDEEETVAFEVGAKTLWFDERLKINVAAFAQKRKDALVTVIDPVMVVNDIGVNAGEIYNKGLEVEVSARPTAGLRIQMAAGYLDAEFEEFTTGGTDFGGNQVPKTFKYTFSGVVSYNMPVTDEMDLFTYLSYKNAKDGFTDNDNFEKMDSPESVDLRVGLKSDAWKLVAFADNITDNRYTSYESNTTNLGGRHWGYYTAGRTYGLQLAYYFQ
ncbi:TonB-dependent receptor [Pseudomaricurvus alkylphenolicus]|uniref:TonB-dependent receptor n=1 Tax=Pseudomaricurvus alkylphenolicus TaxID=1306991 RepID=UPI00141EDE4F|nr:TonB-dependent receptor [Pseudomaricurvus alkylphenolicus]NIB38467.1 TonB-dependent receptor [Pseudomaricurvus alkylphenolicus]